MLGINGNTNTPQKVLIKLDKETQKVLKNIYKKLGYVSWYLSGLGI